MSSESFFSNFSHAGHSRAASEAELEDIVASLRDGNVDARSAAAERLFNKAAVDESARLRTTSLGVVQPLVSSVLSGKSDLSSPVSLLSKPRFCHINTHFIACQWLVHIHSPQPLILHFSSNLLSSSVHKWSDSACD